MKKEPVTNQDQWRELSANGSVRRSKSKNKKDPDGYNTYTESDINEAVIAFTRALGMTAGSYGTVQLYRLMQAYLNSNAARVDINRIVEKTLNETHEG